MASNPVTIYGTTWCGDCRRAKRVLDGQGVSYKWVDIDAVPEAAATVMWLNGGKRSVPTILFPDGSVLVEPSDRELMVRLKGGLDVAKKEALASSGVREGGRWRGASVLTGVGGSVLASLCCLPAAAAVALGLSLGTAVTLSQLSAFQRHFQIAGIATAGLAAWWLIRRSRMSCSLAEQEHRRRRVPLYVFGAFAIGFAALNLAIIPLLEQLPWLLAQR